MVDPMKGLGLLQEVSVWVTGYFHVCFLSVDTFWQSFLCAATAHTYTAQFLGLNDVSRSEGRKSLIRDPDVQECNEALSIEFIVSSLPKRFS